MTTPLDYPALLQFAIEKLHLNVTAAQAKDMTIAQLGVDSLVLMELQMELEDVHGLTLDVDIVHSDTTFGALIGSLAPLA
jgi:acyl carrier protein